MKLNARITVLSRTKPEGVTIDAFKIGYLFTHPSISGDGRIWCVSTPSGRCLGWFADKSIALKIAKDLQDALPYTDWSGDKLEEVLPSREDQRIAYDIVRPWRVDGMLPPTDSLQ